MLCLCAAFLVIDLGSVAVLRTHTQNCIIVLIFAGSVTSILNSATFTVLLR